MNENERDITRRDEQPAQGDERVIESGEERKGGIDVRPVSDPQDATPPPMGGLAPVDSAPAGEGGDESPGPGQDSGGAGDSGE